MMKLALFTGMRRGALFKLQWHDVNFENGIICLRDAKSGRDEYIPMNETARAILTNQPRASTSMLVFPNKHGKQRVCVRKAVARIKKRAGISDFRGLQGLRHVFASRLASSGKVDLYRIQKLLTHKSPQMTQRYAHLSDDALIKASEVMDMFSVRCR